MFDFILDFDLPELNIDSNLGVIQALYSIEGVFFISKPQIQLQQKLDYN